MFFFTFPYFNSIKVQLELCHDLESNVAYSDFNSIKVQLERVANSSDIVGE